MLRLHARADLAGGVAHAETVAKSWSWTLDPVGNWSAHKQDNNGDGDYTDAGDVDQTRTHDNANEITSISGISLAPLYDPAGNNPGAPGRPTIRPADPNANNAAHFRYDAWNRLATVHLDDGDTSGTLDANDTLLATYRYDGLNRRVMKVTHDDPNTTTGQYMYFNENWQIVEVRRGVNPGAPGPTAAAYKQFVWDIRYIDSPVCRWWDKDSDGTMEPAAGEMHYFTNDGNFNTTALVDANSGGVVERYLYDPYGKVTFLDANWAPRTSSSYDNDVLFCGYWYDAETGLFHVRERYYDPVTGTWKTRDRILYPDGMSLYEYCKSGTLTRCDPLGLFVFIRKVHAKYDKLTFAIGRRDGGTVTNGSFSVGPDEGKGDIGHVIIEEGKKDSLWAVWCYLRKTDKDFRSEWGTKWADYLQWATKHNSHITDMNLLKPGDVLHVRPDSATISHRLNQGFLVWPNLVAIGSKAARAAYAEAAGRLVLALEEARTDVALGTLKEPVRDVAELISETDLHTGQPVPRRESATAILFWIAKKALSDKMDPAGVLGKIGTLTIFDRDANSNDLIDNHGEPGLATYSYDPASPERLRGAGSLNRRVMKAVAVDGNSVTDYMYHNENWQIVEVRRGVNQTPTAAAYKQFVYDIRYIDAPVCRWWDKDSDGTMEPAAGEMQYFTNDGNFNTTALIDANSGGVVERYLYDPYGKVTVLNGAAGAEKDPNVAEWSPDADNKSDWDNEILYCGYWYDPETGLFHVRERYYDPITGTWKTRDKILYPDGMNLYEYVTSSPTTKRDPRGLYPGQARGMPSPQDLEDAAKRQRAEEAAAAALARNALVTIDAENSGYLYYEENNGWLTGLRHLIWDKLNPALHWLKEADFGFRSDESTSAAIYYTVYNDLYVPRNLDPYTVLHEAIHVYSDWVDENEGGRTQEGMAYAVSCSATGSRNGMVPALRDLRKLEQILKKTSPVDRDKWVKDIRSAWQSMWLHADVVGGFAEHNRVQFQITEGDIDLVHSFLGFKLHCREIAAMYNAQAEAQEICVEFVCSPVATASNSNDGNELLGVVSELHNPFK